MFAIISEVFFNFNLNFCFFSSFSWWIKDFFWLISIIFVHINQFNNKLKVFKWLFMFEVNLDTLLYKKKSIPLHGEFKFERFAIRTKFLNFFFLDQKPFLWLTFSILILWISCCKYGRKKRWKCWDQSRFHELEWFNVYEHRKFERTIDIHHWKATSC